MPDAAIVFRGVRKSYGAVRALDGVDLSVNTGALFGFLGPNGAGKTTAIRVVAGFIRASAGEARVFGLDPWRDTVAIKRRLGYLPDVPPADGATGRQFLDYMARLRGLRNPSLQRALLDRFELPAAALARPVRGYSQGMRKKLTLVQALQHAPDLLVMDEPTDGLDPLMRHVLFAVLREARSRGATIFMSSHVLSDVEELCSEVALIRAGRIVRAGTVEELRSGRERALVVEFRGPLPDVLDVPGAHEISRQGATVTLGVHGALNGVVRALAKHDLRDIVYERLRLEDLFMDYYGPAGTPAGQGGSRAGMAPGGQDDGRGTA